MAFLPALSQDWLYKCLLKLNSKAMAARIAMKVVDEGGRRGFLIHLRG